MEELAVGSIVEGKVSGITKFGAFVSLPEGRSGLVHISEISYTYVNDVKDHIQEGQDVKVKIIGVDENGRINLSIKKAMDPPPRAEGEGASPRPSRDRGPRPVTFTGTRKQPEPVSFEDKLKRFMASSDSKLSEHHMNERKGSRRGGGGRRGQ